MSFVRYSKGCFHESSNIAQRFVFITKIIQLKILYHVFNRVKTSVPNESHVSYLQNIKFQSL